MHVDLEPVVLSAAQVRDHYHGFSNGTLWPLFHNAIGRPRFERSWWLAYQQVNDLFSERASAVLDRHTEALTWVHDYQLMLVPALLRDRQPDVRIGFFLHVPWPPPDIFARLPWRRELLNALLGADVISFHTDRYRRNFLRAVRRLLGPAGVEVRDNIVVNANGRRIAVTAAPISIDVAAFERFVAEPAVEAEIGVLRRQFNGRSLLLGVDRLDYTKGIVERLLAFERLLERRTDLHGRIALLQIAAPTRDDVPAYRTLRDKVETIVGRINGRFTKPGGDVPVHYLYRSVSQQQLTAYYAIADALLVTPLADGMNLIAKEYVTVQHASGGSGALVLSEFTGASDELHEAILCNPFDIEGLSARFEDALNLPEAERIARLADMSRTVTANDIHLWVANQLDSITSPC